MVKLKLLPQGRPHPLILPLPLLCLSLSFSVLSHSALANASVLTFRIFLAISFRYTFLLPPTPNPASNLYLAGTIWAKFYHI